MLLMGYCLFAFGFAGAVFNSTGKAPTDQDKAFALLVGATWPLWLGYAAAVHSFPKKDLTH